MSFIWPYVLIAYLFVPIYIWLHFIFEKKRNKDLIPFGNIEALKEVIAKTKIANSMVHLPLILHILILSCLILAVARPQANVLVPSKNSQVMLLLDNSISMEATDISPTRLDAARDTAIKFVKELPKGIKIGIGIFSANVKILVNPTLKKEKVIAALNSLNLNALEPGTAIGDAVKAGTSALAYGNELTLDKTNNTLVLITDGEVNIGIDPLFAASIAKNNNIAINTIGIGSPNGTIIRGSILTRLDEVTLQQISSFTNGDYFKAANLNDMNDIYKKIKTSIKLDNEKTEVTYLPVCIALFFLFIIQILKWSKFRFA